MPRTELIGDSDRYVKTGSTVHLQCIIYGAIEPPTYIMWYHDAQPIHADNKLGYKMHLIKANMQRPNNDAAIKYELNDLVQPSYDDTHQRQNSVNSNTCNCPAKSYLIFRYCFWFLRLGHFLLNQRANIILVIIHAIHRTVLQQLSLCMSSAVSVFYFHSTQLNFTQTIIN